MSSAGLLWTICVLGGGLVGFLLVVRHVDQRSRDARRRVFAAQHTRTEKEEHVAAVLQTVSGLAAPRTGLLGRDTVVFEVVGTRDAIQSRLRLPEGSAGHFVAQLRAAVPGVGVTELEPEAARFRVASAQELRRTDPTRPLAADDPAAVSRAVIAACGGLHGGETVIWQWVVTGGGQQQAADVSWRAATRRALGRAGARRQTTEDGVIGAVLRIGATGRTHARTRGLVAGLVRVAGSVSAPGARLLPRRLPQWLVRRRLERAATPLVESPVQVRPDELVALLGWPIGAPVVPGLVLGGSPQLPVTPAVPKGGRVLGDATVGGKRSVAQSHRTAREHSLYVAPTGTGKTWLAANIALGDIERGDGVLVLDPKGGLVRAILERLPEEAISRTILVDPTDEARPVPLPLLAAEQGGIPEMAADTLVGLLRHRYRDLGPRSSDILSSSLYALARVPDATLFDLLPLWSIPAFRARVARLVSDDPALASFFAWFDGLAPAERNFILAAPMNKIRPLLQRPIVRNVLAAPRATFTLTEAMARRLAVLISTPEGLLGQEPTGLLGQVVLARMWAAVQGRARSPESARRPFFVTVDEAPRFVDQPTDLGDVLARSREYGVGVTLIGQSLRQFPESVREIALNSARTKVAFQSSASDARRLAQEFGPTVTPEMLQGLAAFEAIGVVSVGGAVSDPFTFRTRPLPEKIPGRAKAVRAASRERWGVPREEIEASFTRHQQPPESPGPVGRRVKR